jgi:peptidoglycan-associated lipoprotein
VIIRNRSMQALGCLVALSALFTAAGCSGHKERPPATTSGPPPSVSRTSTAPVRDTSPPEDSLRPESGDSSLSSLTDPDDISGRTLEDINANSPLADIPFEFDSAVLLDQARATLDRHADWLNRHPTVTLLIEGHCDERGTVEYNLALGERRAAAASAYLSSLGIPANRLKTISYGKEFPLDPGHTDEAWSRNRRAHFQITAK